jgi:hypothetical protein
MRELSDADLGMVAGGGNTTLFIPEEDIEYGRRLEEAKKYAGWGNGF